jgi:hypothetical protein
MSTITQRKNSIIEKVRAGLGKPNLPYSAVSQSMLRLEQVLTTQSVITFNVLSNAGNGTILAPEIRLNLNDAFVVTHIGFRVAKVAAASPTTNQIVNKKLYTNPNPFIFDGAAGDVNIAGLFNGVFSLEVNQKKFIPSLSMLEFLRYPDTQEGSQTGVMTGPAYSRAANDAKPSGNFGFVETDEILLTGTQTILPSISLPQGYTASFTETNEVNYAVLLLKGYLFSNEGNFSA